MAGDKLPARRSEEVRPAHVECQGESPNGRLRPGIEQGSPDEKGDADRGAPGEGPHRVTEIRVVTAGDQEEDDLPDPNRPVGERELGREVSERVRHGDRGDQEGGHRGEQGDPHPALLGIDDAGQPRVSDPGPPEQGEDHQPMPEPSPGRVLRHQRRALGEREDEDQVEEQLEGQHLLALAKHGPQPASTRLRHRRHGRILPRRPATLRRRDFDQSVQERHPHRRRWDRLPDRRVPAREAREGRSLRPLEAEAGRGRRRDRQDVQGRREVQAGPHRDAEDAVPLRLGRFGGLHGQHELRPGRDPEVGRRRRAQVGPAELRRRSSLRRRAPRRSPAPSAVDLAVSQTDPGLKGDTASGGGTKPATLETGVVVQVPLFIEEGERVRVDTRSGEYVSRA